MSDTRITRPDVFKVDQFQISLDETMLLWLEEGVQNRIHHLYESIYSHSQCDLRHEGGCEIRKQWIVNRYGSLEEGFAQGCQLTDCTEDLMWLHGEVSSLMSFLFQARYLRNNPTEQNAFCMHEAVSKLKDIKQQVKVEATGEYPTVKPQVTDEQDQLTEELVNDEAANQSAQHDPEVWATTENTAEGHKSRARQRFEQKQLA